MTGKAEATKQRILETYQEKTPTSKHHHEKARAFLPGGDTRTICHFRPYPVYMRKGEGWRLIDCEGNAYIDFLSNYTSLIFGHAHPALTEAAQALVMDGTAFGALTEMQYRHAQHLIERVPSLERVRYCNSGTEATLFSLRGARAYTGRDLVVKMDGGYHGTHDLAGVNARPEVQESELPSKRLPPGVPRSTLEDVLIAPYNDLNAVGKLLEENKDKVAAVIVEPVMGAGGLIFPEPGYLEGLRQVTAHHDVVLIFDEIISLRVHRGGMQGLEKVVPDMTTLGKWIGGGFPVGAFGGREEIMAVFDPSKPDAVSHSGTFNANNLTMGVGLTALELVDQAAIDRLNLLGDRLRDGMTAALREAEIKARMSGYGSMVGLHWREAPPRNARESAQGHAGAGELPALFHLEMLNRGIYCAPRGMYIVSMPMTEAEIEACIDAFSGALSTVRPYIEEQLPHILV